MKKITMVAIALIATSLAYSQTEKNKVTFAFGGHYGFTGTRVTGPSYGWWVRVGKLGYHENVSQFNPNYSKILQQANQLLNGEISKMHAVTGHHHVFFSTKKGFYFGPGYGTSYDIVLEKIGVSVSGYNTAIEVPAIKKTNYLSGLLGVRYNIGVLEGTIETIISKSVCFNLGIGVRF